MPRPLVHISIALLVVAVLTGCSPTQAPRTVADGAATEAAPQSGRTLVMAIKTEPNSLSARPLDTSPSTPATPQVLFNATLVGTDDLNAPFAQLAVALPELNTESWRVFPDGRMETTYTLKPGLRWQDGTPLSAEDFVFAWQLFRTPELGASGAMITAIESVSAPDERSVLIRWRQPFTDANNVTGGRTGLPPLPRHILESTFRDGSPESVANHPFWTREYVGLGPYQLARWEPGSFIEANGFAGFVGGAPKISRLRLTFINDASTALANLMAGDVHVAVDSAVGFEQASSLKQGWAPRSGSVLLTPTKTRYVQIQFKPDYVRPAAILDVRVRAALAHAFNKPEMASALLNGEPGNADTLVSPQEEYYPALDRVLTRYPYDTRRAAELMAQAGFTPDSSGLYADARGNRLTTELWGTAGEPAGREVAILTDDWKRAGFDIVPNLISNARAQDQEYVSTFPALRAEQSNLTGEQPLSKIATVKMATPQNRWAGSNRGGWSNAEYDRLYAVFVSSLDRAERNDAAVQFWKLTSEDLPLIPLYYNYEVTAFAMGLHGPKSGNPNFAVFDIQDWTLD